MAAGLSVPTNFFRASGIVAKLMLHFASPEARVGPPSEANDSGLPRVLHCQIAEQGDMWTLQNLEEDY